MGRRLQSQRQNGCFARRVPNKKKDFSLSKPDWADSLRASDLQLRVHTDLFVASAWVVRDVPLSIGQLIR